VIGAPEPGGMNFQPGATELARDIRALDGMLLVIITAIVLFVTALLAWTIVRHNARANPSRPASRTTPRSR
jgi:cytochrome c oxidase subunit 2